MSKQIENIENEIWKDIPGYEGIYEVSSIGRARSIDRYSPHYKGGMQFKKGVVRKQY